MFGWDFRISSIWLQAPIDKGASSFGINNKISIALTKSLLKEINIKCKQTGLSRSSFIEMILRQHCRNKFIETELEKSIQTAKYI